jgi:tetratricopeptide (TPR) repeat protein
MIFFALTDTTNISKRFSDFKEIITTTKEDDSAMERSSFRERIIMWDNALKVASDYPVSGVGLANLKIIAPEYGLGTAYHIAEGNIVYTHPHNEFLFVLGETGIVGLLIYLTLFVTLFYYSWKLSARAENVRDLIRAGAYLFLIVSFVVIAAVSLPSTRFYPTILLMLAAAMLVHNQRKEGRSTGNTGISLPKKRSLLTFGGLIICVSIYAIPLGITRLKSDFAVSEALIQERQRNFEVMKRYLLKVDREAYPVDVTGTPIARYLGYTEFYLGNLEKAFEYFTEAEKANRNHLMLLNDLGTCYNLKGDPATAEIYYRRALSNQPYFGKALVNLAVLQYNAGLLDSSYQTLMKHKTKISQDAVNVFSTIISAKAVQYTADTIIINKLKYEYRNIYSSQDAFLNLKNTPGGLPEYLKKL